MIKFPHKVCAAGLISLLLAACGGGGSGAQGSSGAAYTPPATGASAPAGASAPTGASAAAAYQVGLNPADPNLPAAPVRPGSTTSSSGEVLSGGATTPNANSLGVTSCKLTASYFTSGSPAIPTLTAGATTNLDQALQANPSLATPTAWDGVTQPTVLGMSSNLAANGLNTPAGYPTAPDTNRIQAALYACANPANAYDTANDLATNGVVELAPGPAGTQTAFVTGPLNMPGGVTLVIDQGVTLFASRDPVLYESGSTGASTNNAGDVMWGGPTASSGTTPPTGSASNATQTSTALSSTSQYYCGQVYGNDNGCTALIGNVVYIPKSGTYTGTTFSKVYTSNNAVMGPGVIDGQGGQPLYSLMAGTTVGGEAIPPLLMRADNVTTMSWWDIGWEGNEALSGQDQDNPRLVVPQYGYNFTLFDITLQNAPKIHVSPEGVTGFTAWKLKIFTPTAAYTAMTNYWGANYDYATVKNTDGFDPELKGSSSSSTPAAPALTGNYGSAPNGTSYASFTGDMSNILLAYSYISDSDDNIAVKGENSSSSSGPSKLDTDGALYNMTVAHDHFFYGHGMSIGSQTAGGGSVGHPTAGLMAVATPLSYTTGTDAWTSSAQQYVTQPLYPGVTNINVYDLALDYTDNGVRIKTNWSEGGLVSNINYTNLCMQGNPTPSTYDPNPQTAIYIFPSYSATGNAGLLPSYQNITVNGLHELSAASWQMQGFNSASPVLSASGWTGGPGTTPTTINGTASTAAIVNPLGLTLNNVVADQAPVAPSGTAPVTVTDANIKLGANVSANLGLMAFNGTNNVTVTSAASAAAATTVDCSQAFANIPGNTDANGNAINSPFPGQVFPIVINGQTVPALQ